MNVLIDNSTYYSFKMAMQENYLDAHTVYNMANFLECLVVTDKVFLSPTTIWRPDQTDGSLFSDEGPCVPLTVLGPDEMAVRKTFADAIEESIKDLSRNVIRDTGIFAREDLEKTKQLLKSWQDHANQNPLNFMETYSDPVYLTDSGTAEFFAKTFRGYKRAVPAHHHLAHYLLRCNVAMQISERLVYHPHSHRTPLVCAKMALKARESASLVSALIRDSETVIETKISENVRRAILSRYGAFSSVDSDLPLVLAVVLSGAKTPADIISRALDLRNTRAARRYRDWTTKLVLAVREGNAEGQIKAARELEEAKQVLTAELIKLYDARRKTDLSRFSNLISVADVAYLEPLLSANLRGILFKAGKKLVESAPEGLSWIKKMQVRRKVALLLNLAKKRRQIDRLNLLLERTFHKSLTPEQTCTLNTLRMNQGKLMAQLICTS